jgi:RNA polymerase sigma factor (sigma-70 family)
MVRNLTPLFDLNGCDTQTEMDTRSPRNSTSRDDASTFSGGASQGVEPGANFGFGTYAFTRVTILAENERGHSSEEDRAMVEGLVQSAQNGDSRAFAKLVEVYCRPIYGLVFSIVGNWQATEDIAQDAFLVAWTDIRRLRTLDAFGAWLRRIARNLARNWIRSECYRRALLERRAILGNAVGPEPCAPVEDLEMVDTRAEVWGALATLSPRLRETVVLFYLEEKSVAETAAQLGITENAVKKRLQHARHRMRAFFEEQWKAELERERQRINPREAGERFMARAALGPVSGLVGTLGAGPGLWLHGALHGEGAGRLVSSLSAGGGLVRPLAVALAIAAVSGAGLFWNAQRQGASAGELKPLPELSRHVPVDAPAAVPAYAEPAIADKEAPKAAQARNPGRLPAKVGPTEEAVSSVTVKGRVVDEEQRPISGATVTVVASGLDGLTVEHAVGFGGGGGVGSVDGLGEGWSGGDIGFGPWAAAGGDDGAELAESGDPGITYGGEAVVGAGSFLFADKSIHGDALDRVLLDESRRFRAESGSDGSFTIEGVPLDGQLIISAVAPGYCMQGMTLSPDFGSPPTGLTLVLPTGISFGGRVLSARGQPVADALVQVTGMAWTGNGSAGGWGRSPQVWGWTRTDARGKFTIEVDGPGNASIVVRSLAEGKAVFRDIPLEPGANVELRFPERLELRGTITRPDGTPASGHVVQLTGYTATSIPDDGQGNGAWSETAALTYEATTDAAGAYEIMRVDPAGRYAASVYDPDGAPLATDMDVEVPVSGQTLVWDYTLPRPTTVKGVVHEPESGRPAVGTVILCRKADDEPQHGVPAAMPVAQAVSGSDGSFEVRITSGPGSYAFGIQTSMGFHSLSEKEMREGDTAVLDLTLPGLYARDFHVIDEAGNPLPGVSVLILGEGSDLGYAYPEQTGEDGRIRVGGLIAGEPVKCRFLYGGHEAESETLAGQAGIEPAEETIVIAGAG